MPLIGSLSVKVFFCKMSKLRLLTAGRDVGEASGGERAMI